MPKVPMFIRVEPELKKWLEDRAENERRSASDYARIVLEDHKKNVDNPRKS